MKESKRKKEENQDINNKHYLWCACVFAYMRGYVILKRTYQLMI